MPVHQVHAWCLRRRPEEGVGVPGTGVTDGFEPPCELWEVSPGHLEERLVLLAAEPSLQLLLVFTIRPPHLPAPSCLCCCSQSWGADWGQQRLLSGDTVTLTPHSAPLIPQPHLHAALLSVRHNYCD